MADEIADVSVSEPEDFDLPLTDDVHEAETADAPEADSVATASVEAKPESKAEPEPEPDATLEELRRKREERSKRIAEERERVAATSRLKELEARAAIADKIDAVKSGKARKLDVLREIGIDLNDLIAEHIETMEGGLEAGEQPTKADSAVLKRLEQLEAEVKAKRDAEEAAERDAQERLNRERASAAVSAAVEKARQVLAGDDYELINALGEHEGVYHEFAAYCNKHGLKFAADEEDDAVAMFKTFAKQAEDKLAARLEKAAGTKKFKARIGGTPRAAASTAQSAAVSTARTGRGHVAPPIQTGEEDDLPLDPRKRARALARSIRIVD